MQLKFNHQPNHTNYGIGQDALGKTVRKQCHKKWHHLVACQRECTVTYLVMKSDFVRCKYALRLSLFDRVKLNCIETVYMFLHSKMFHIEMLLIVLANT